MNTELKKEYDTIQEILLKLDMLLKEAKEKDNSNNSVEVILDSIKSVKKDEKRLLKKIRESIYKKYTKEDIDSYEREIEIEKKKEEERKKEEKKQEFNDAKIVFNGEYKLVYCNGTKVITKRLDRQLLDKNADFAYDYNICDFLRSIDDEKGTDLYRRYRYGQLDVVYNFYNIRRLDRKAIKQLRKISKEASLRSKNVTEEGIKKNRFKTFLASSSLVAMIGLSALGLGLASKKNSKTDTTNVSTTKEISLEKSVEEDIVEITKIDDRNIVDDTNKNISKVQENVKLKVESIDQMINDTEKTIKSTQESVRTKISKDKEDNEFLGLNIGSSMELPDMDLYYSSTEDKAVGNTKYLRAHTGIYKIDLISIVYKGKCLEVIKNEGYNMDGLKQYVKDTYGDDIKISINLDVVDENGNTIYKNVGWVNSEIFSKKSNVKSLVMNK